VQRSPVDVLNGLRELRAAALLQIAASILVGISGFMQLPLPFNFEPLAVGLSRSVLLVVAMILAIISVYFYLLPSAEQFSLQKPEEFSTPSKLMRAGYLGGVTLILLSNLIIIVGVTTMGSSGSLGTNLAILGSLALAITGGIMLLAGLIGIIIYFLRLKDMFNSTPFLITAILLAASVLIPVGFIAWILAFAEASLLEKKISVR
jgi:hypothetical protein